MKQFKSVAPISHEDTNAIPVREIGRAIMFYTDVLGFSLVTKEERSAVLRRDDAQIGLIARADHDPGRAGSFYFDVSDVGALWQELAGKQAKPGAIEIQEYEGKRYRLFFLRECDLREVHDGYCFCFGQPVQKAA